ncbi:casein kinase II regulatory subunit-domain-containing protein [Cristinia sonorae]|uniref:Casein kinase II subunit beta n=1 Tax=Cristinia sonorae TaxID=1940300 RepID=A0A8K0XTI8_9AGAR|nr:casein kinase II regulatory subunit-domain-containing protein [Cristinia sonorae]
MPHGAHVSLLAGRRLGLTIATMSRLSSQPPPADTSQAELEEDEIISGTGEGDEVMEDAQDQEEGYSSSTPTSSLTWISWFCALPGHEYFCEVAEDFIEDDFNLTGLNAMVPFWKEAMEMVLDVEPDTSKIPDVSIVEASAELLYGLVHQRFILTRAGLQLMVDKYEAGVFGACPRVYCYGCHVVPCGRSDLPGLDTVKLFCPNCNDIYTPPSSRFQGVDGAFFGTTFAHLFFQSYRLLAPAPFWKPSSSSSMSPRSSGSSSSQQQLSQDQQTQPSSQQTPQFVNPNPNGGQRKAAGRVYVPRIYGFKVSERAKNGPRMQWLRLRPQDPEELDLVDWRGQWYEDADDDYEEEEDEDRPMEDFDPDHHEGDEDEEEEEEEEEEEHGGGRPLERATGTSRRTLSPPSSAPPRTPPEVFSLGATLGAVFKQPDGGRLKVVRQHILPEVTTRVS